MSIGEAVPTRVRRAVIERDGHCCRVCGRWVETVGLHHVVFRSHGGPNTEDNLVVVGWLPGHDCHLVHAHGVRAAVFREALQVCILTPGLTAVQLLRWGGRLGPRPSAAG